MSENLRLRQEMVAPKDQQQQAVATVTDSLSDADAALAHNESVLRQLPVIQRHDNLLKGLARANAELQRENRALKERIARLTNINQELQQFWAKMDERSRAFEIVKTTVSNLARSIDTLTTPGLIRHLLAGMR